MTTDSVLARRWPEALIKQIAARKFVLVVGSGVSKNSSNASGQSPPTWVELMKSLTKDFTQGRGRTLVNNLVTSGRLLEAAEVLKTRARAQAREQDFLDAIAKATDGDTDTFQPNPVHDSLMRLEPDIIITTNYDRILERATESGYSVHSSDFSELASEVRTGSPLICKIHGSVDRKTSMILTRSDYSRLRRSNAEGLEVLQALLLTRMTLFVGYSFSDPDIQLLLENVLGARGGPAAHYLLTPDSIAQYELALLEYCHGTAAIKYRAGVYEEMARMLELLAGQVESARLVA